MLLFLAQILYSLYKIPEAVTAIVYPDESHLRTKAKYY